MTPTEKHRLLEKVLWALKVPEILFTAASIIGFVVYGFGLISVEILLLAFLLRLILFPVRIGIVRMKRNIEQEYHIAHGIYVPAIVKTGTKKFDFVRYK